MNHKTIGQHIAYVIDAHQTKTNKFGKTVRNSTVSNEKFPYFSHPLWCATMILSEPNLPEDLRELGCEALLFHDILEDTTQPLPKNLDKNSKIAIQKMTVSKEEKYNFSSWEKEKETILNNDEFTQLLKLYDKTATLYDGSISKDRIDEWANIVIKLANNVQSTYGDLNIVFIARDLAKRRKQKLRT